MFAGIGASAANRCMQEEATEISEDTYIFAEPWIWGKFSQVHNNIF